MGGAWRWSRLYKFTVHSKYQMTRLYCVLLNNEDDRKVESSLVLSHRRPPGTLKPKSLTLVQGFVKEIFICWQAPKLQLQPLCATGQHSLVSSPADQEHYIHHEQHLRALENPRPFLVRSSPRVINGLTSSSCLTKHFQSSTLPAFAEVFQPSLPRRLQPSTYRPPRSEQY